MSNRFARILFALALAGAALPTSAQKFTEESVARQPWNAGTQISSLTISPDGRHLAGVGHRGIASAVIVIDIDTKAQRIVAAPERDSRYRFGQLPLAVHWAANDILVVDYNNRESISLDLAGKKLVSLGQRFIRRMVEKGKSDLVLAYSDIEDGEFDLVNARSGEPSRYAIELPGKPVSWAFDAAGSLRAVTMVEPARWGGQEKIGNWYRASEQGAWQLLEAWPESSSEYWWALRALPEPNTLAVMSRNGRDTYAVFRYDTAKRQQVELMAGHAQEDITSVKGLDSPVFERVMTDGIKPRISWFDPRWASLQAAVDAAIPGRMNYLEGDKQGRVLVISQGDVDPGRWFILDTKTSRMEEIAEAMPGIRPAAMRPMETLRYVARDGLSVPAYLTRPANASTAPAPAVVLIHGGPHVRDRWFWNREVQMLAHAGYVVFQPQFRGSTGFGRKFKEAGYRQWGRAMQDDITDGVRWLIEQKIADPSRICIYGASYGGYAALWGTIKTPELFKCGVSFAGVSDLGELVSGSLLDDSTPITREVRRERIGDPVADRAALDEVSPLKHAGRVGVPLLIAHGANDRRVLPSQSEAMVRALRDAGRPVEWLPLPEEGHGLFWTANRMRYYTALLNFLDRHIGDRHPVRNPEATAPK